MLARNAAARKFFAEQIPSYQRAATLAELSARGELIPQFIRRRAPASRSR